MHLSIVFPTLHKVAAGVVLATRIRELCGPDFEFEVVVVTRDASVPLACPEIRFVKDEGRGVYPAYSCGVRAARGEYTWLLGDDDLPLDSFARVAPALVSGRYDIIVAPVVYSTGRFYRPTKSALVLLFYNWCQQGIVYRTEKLRQYRFYKRLRIQADHFVNILLFADRSLNVLFFGEAICLFGAHGISSLGGDRAFKKMRPVLAQHTLSLPELAVFKVCVAIADLYKLARRLFQ